VLKVAILAEKYATDYKWYVDVILNLIRLAGDYVSEEVNVNFKNISHRTHPCCGSALVSLQIRIQLFTSVNSSGSGPRETNQCGSGSGQALPSQKVEFNFLR
jgi:hypothetical protein